MCVRADRTIRICHGLLYITGFTIRMFQGSGNNMKRVLFHEPCCTSHHAKLRILKFPYACCHTLQPSRLLFVDEIWHHHLFIISSHESILYDYTHPNIIFHNNITSSPPIATVHAASNIYIDERELSTTLPCVSYKFPTQVNRYLWRCYNLKYNHNITQWRTRVNHSIS